jgi:hypothetical protein
LAPLINKTESPIYSTARDHQPPAAELSLVARQKKQQLIHKYRLAFSVVERNLLFTIFFLLNPHVLLTTSLDLRGLQAFFSLSGIFCVAACAHVWLKGSLID